MKTEITKERLSGYFYPSKNFYREDDDIIVDYAEIEIDPTGIKKLEDNLERCTTTADDWDDEEEWEALTDESSDYYEHIVAYVHFVAGTELFDKLFISVVDCDTDKELDVDTLLTREEKNIIIEAGLEHIRKYRNTDLMTDCEGFEVKEIIESRRDED